MGSSLSTTDPDNRSAPRGVDSYADVVERLFGEFEDRYPLSVIVAAVQECRVQLPCSPATAMPELLERLARQRLSTAGGTMTDGVPDRPQRRPIGEVQDRGSAHAR